MLVMLLLLLDSCQRLVIGQSEGNSVDVGLIQLVRGYDMIIVLLRVRFVLSTRDCTWMKCTRVGMAIARSWSWSVHRDRTQPSLPTKLCRCIDQVLIRCCHLYCQCRSWRCFLTRICCVCLGLFGSSWLSDREGGKGNLLQDTSQLIEQRPVGSTNGVVMYCPTVLEVLLFRKLDCFQCLVRLSILATSRHVTRSGKPDSASLSLPSVYIPTPTTSDHANLCHR